MIQMQCPVCGKFQDVKEGRSFAFCMFCGTKMDVPAPAAPVAGEAEAAAAAETASAAEAAAPVQETAAAQVPQEETPVQEEPKAPEEPPKKKKSRKGLIAALIALVLLLGAGAAGYFFFLKPSNEYKAAVTAMEEGRFDDAIAAFEELGSYKDSAAKIDDCILGRALTELDAGKYTRALKSVKSISSETLDTSAFNKKAGELVNGMIASGEYEDALDALEQLEGRTESVADSVRAAFEKELKANKLDQAQKIAERFADYCPDKTYAKAAVEKQAAALIGSNEYTSAYDMISKFSEQKPDIREAVKQAIGQKLNDNDFENLSMLLHAFSDQLPEAAELEGPYRGKLEELVAADDSEKADTLVFLYEDFLETADSVMGEVASEALDKAIADKDGERISGILDSYSYYDDSLPEKVKAAAQALIDEKNYDDALDLVDGIDTYRLDVREIVYAAASGLLEDKDYDRAAQLFDDLGYYENSYTLMQEASYRKAVALMEEDKLDEADEIFEDLSGYADSRDKRKEITCRKAIAILSKDSPAPQDLVDAYTLLDGIRGYSDADDLIMDTLYYWIDHILAADDQMSYASAMSDTVSLKTAEAEKLILYVMEEVPALCGMEEDGSRWISQDADLMEALVEMMTVFDSSYSQEIESFRKFVLFISSTDYTINRTDIQTLFPYRDDLIDMITADPFLLFFLTGEWKDESGEILMKIERKESYSLDYNMSGPEQPAGSVLGHHLRGFCYMDADRTELVRICNITVIDYNTIEVENLADGETYLLTR